MRANVVSPMNEEKFQMNMENDGDDQNQLIRSRFLARNRSWRWTSLILPCLLALFILIGTILLFITVSRWNTCRRQQVEQAQSILGFIPNDLVRRKSIQMRNIFNNESFFFFCLDENMDTVCGNRR